MNKKKIILLIIIFISAGAVVCLLILPRLKSGPAAPVFGEIKPTFRAPSGMPPLSITTDKTSYEHNKSVKISVFASGSKNIPSFGSCEISIKRTENRSMEEIDATGPEEKFVLDESSDECKKYKSGFVFDLDGTNSKSLEWDQGSCENGSIPASAVPDDYSILVSCDVKKTENYSGPEAFSDSRSIRINEDASCKNKKIEILKAGYDKKGLLSIEIKNAGTENIANVRIYLDKCSNKKTVTKEKDSGEIIAGNSIIKTLASENDCRYVSLNAHVDECYDGNPESWTNSDILIP